MGKTVLDKLSTEKREQLFRLRSELEGELLVPLLKRLMERFELSVNQLAISAGIDESTMHKVLNGAHREFKAGAADALVDDLVTLGKLTTHDQANQLEKTIWLRALRIASFLHFEFYKAIMPRIKDKDPETREAVLEQYLEHEYPALAETYDATGGKFPVFVPLAFVVAQQLLKRWGAITGVEPTITAPETDSPHIETPDLPRIKIGKDGKRMILIPAGWFLMGTSEADFEKLHVIMPKWQWKMIEGERPQHRVYLDTYYIDETPVTNTEYKRFLDENPGHNIPNGWLLATRTFLRGEDNHPVNHVTQHEALTYARWAGKLLPTEAQWEKAARGPDGRWYPWGNEQPTATRCNFNNNEKGTTPVGTYSPHGDSPYGVKDLAGNIWEWVADWYDATYYRNSPARNPFRLLPPSGLPRLVRGGSWEDNAIFVRSGLRCNLGPTWMESTGFRCVQWISLL